VFRNYCKNLSKDKNFDDIFGEHKNCVKNILDSINVNLKISFKIYINLSLALSIIKQVDKINPEQSLNCVFQLFERVIHLIKISRKEVFIPAGFDSNAYFKHASICSFVKKAPNQIRVYAIDASKHAGNQSIRTAKVKAMTIDDYVRTIFFMQVPSCFDRAVTDVLTNRGKNTLENIQAEAFAHLGYIDQGGFLKPKKRFAHELFETPTCAIHNLFTFIRFYVWKEVKNNPKEVDRYMKGCDLLFKRFMER
jgi:hypothetical protein